MKQMNGFGLVAMLLMLNVGCASVEADMMKKDSGMMDKMHKEDTMMAEQQHGMLRGSGDHHASGKVSIGKDKMGQVILKLSDIRVDKVPDGRVYIAKGGDYTQGIELGKLTRFKGEVHFAIPANVNPQDYDGVVIWCKKFDVEIGRADFESTMMKKGMMKEDMMDKGMME